MSPEAIGPVKPKHLRTLERRMNYLIAETAQYNPDDPDPGYSWDMAEIAALRVVLAELKERQANAA